MARVSRMALPWDPHRMTNRNSKLAAQATGGDFTLGIRQQFSRSSIVLIAVGIDVTVALAAARSDANGTGYAMAASLAAGVACLLSLAFSLTVAQTIRDRAW